MILYRLCLKKYAETAWNGIGSTKSTTARWNRPGTALAYTATSVSLAMLEILVHLNDNSILKNFQAMRIEVPDDLIVIIDVTTLPDGWDNYVPIPETKDIGTDWYDGESSIGLMVPSVIIPIECNVLINTRHTEFTACQKTIQLLDIPFDPRLLKNRTTIARPFNFSENKKKWPSYIKGDPLGGYGISRYQQTTS